MYNLSRVFISGMGVVSPNGTGLIEYWNNTKNGISGIREIDFFETTQNRVKIAGFVPDLNKLFFKHKVSESIYDRVSILLKTAADEAITLSGINLRKIPNNRIGIIFGLGMSGMHSVENWFKDFFVEKTGFAVDDFIASFPNSPGSIIAIEYGIKGMNYTINTACSSSVAAIGLAFLLIQRGIIDVCITGGADAPLTSSTLKNFERLKILNTKSNDEPQRACKPFSKDRRGFILSEGAGVLILESEQHLEQRDGKKECEIIGYGSSNDASSIIAPDLDGQALAVKLALENAFIKPDDMDYIHAHGTGTKINDIIETKVIKKIYKNKAYKIPISSVKSMIGHTIGASGAISIICTVQGLNNNYLPPTINLEIPDPECDLDFIAKTGRPAKAKIAAVHSFGFGGNNNVIILKKTN